MEKGTFKSYKSAEELKNDFINGKYDELISELYNCKDLGADYCRERYVRVIKGFCNTFDGGECRITALFSSPGRLELTGNHTDHQGGAVLTGTVCFDIIACVSENHNKMINVVSEGYGSFSMNCDDTTPRSSEKNTTAALVRGIVRAVSDKGFRAGGMDIYLVSDLPVGLGMSSSAAFEMLIGSVINSLFCQNQLSGEEIAYAGMFAEREYFGKPCGLMDQMACITGGINIFDFRDDERPAAVPVDIDFENEGIDIIITDTGTDHADLADDFNAIPAEMYSVAEVMGGKRLCDIDENVFYDRLGMIRGKVGDRALMRAMHWYDETKRVKRQGEALNSRNIKEFLQLINRSGQSSFMYLQNADDYADPASEPVALSLALSAHLLKDGHGAVRIQGGGFGGSIIAFVKKDFSDRYILNMEKFLGKGCCQKVYIRKKGVVSILA